MHQISIHRRFAQANRTYIFSTPKKKVSQVLREKQNVNLDQMETESKTYEPKRFTFPILEVNSEFLGIQ